MKLKDIEKYGLHKINWDLNLQLSARGMNAIAQMMSRMNPELEIETIRADDLKVIRGCGPLTKKEVITALKKIHDGRELLHPSYRGMESEIESGMDLSINDLNMLYSGMILISKRRLIKLISSACMRKERKITISRAEGVLSSEAITWAFSCGLNVHSSDSLNSTTISIDVIDIKKS